VSADDGRVGVGHREGTAEEAKCYVPTVLADFDNPADQKEMITRNPQHILLLLLSPTTPMWCSGGGGATRWPR
jgi:hypothetical protein